MPGFDGTGPRGLGPGTGWGRGGCLGYTPYWRPRFFGGWGLGMGWGRGLGWGRGPGWGGGWGRGFRGRFWGAGPWGWGRRGCAPGPWW